MRDVARQWAEVYCARLRNATHDRQRGIKQRHPLKAAVKEYLSHRQNTVEHNTWLSDVNVTGHLIEAFGNRDVQSISQEEVQRWFEVRAPSYAPKTLALYAIHMRTFFRWADRPIDKIKLRTPHRPDPDALTDTEVDAMLGACKTEREQIVIRTGLATGARKAELWALEWADFRADGRSTRIARQIAWPRTDTKGLKGKRNRSALVLPGYMDTLTRGTIGRVIPGWVVSTESASDVVVRVLKRAELWRPGRGTHVLRHTYSRIGLERHQWSIEMLRLFLGHESIKTTEVYAHFGEEAAIKLAMERTYGS